MISFMIKFSFVILASAMSVLQSKGIVHRDLKPQNLLLNHSGSSNPPPSDIKVKIGKNGGINGNANTSAVWSGIMMHCFVIFYS